MSTTTRLMTRRHGYALGLKRASFGRFTVPSPTGSSMPLLRCYDIQSSSICGTDGFQAPRRLAAAEFARAPAALDCIGPGDPDAVYRAATRCDASVVVVN